MEDIDLWEEKERISQFERKYLHFDQKSSINTVKKFIIKPEEIQRHYFYPFIQSNITTPRFKKDKDNGNRIWDKKVRPIMYASHVDSLIYSYYNILLNRKYEEKIRDEKFQESILAYRKLKKSNIDFADEVFSKIASFGECIVLAFDVTKFFDTLDHGVLKKAWENLLDGKNLSEHRDHLNVFKSLTKYSFVDKAKIEKEFEIVKRRKTGERLYRFCSGNEFRTRVREKHLIEVNQLKVGIPQGSPISALLSNVYMLEFDKKVYQEVVTNRNGIYRRYSDDILIVCAPNDGEDIEKMILDEIKGDNFRLEIQEAKTDKFRLTDRDAKRKLRPINIKTGRRQNIQYLGFEYDGDNIFIRSSSLSRYYRRMKYRVHTAVKDALRGKSKLVFKKKLLLKNTEHATRIKASDDARSIRRGHSLKNDGFIGNFITYAQRSSRKMNSIKILRQIKNHRKNLDKAIQGHCLRKCVSV